MEMTSTPSQGSHSLAFRVMRLCKPSFQVEPPLRLDPTNLLIGEDLLDDLTAASYLPSLLNSATHLSDPEKSDLSYRTRLLLHQPTDAMGLSGLLILPQSFGSAIFIFTPN